MTKHQAEKRPVEITQHGQKRVDNYAWLRDENWKEFIKGNLNFKDPKVKEFLDKENQITNDYMKPLEGLKAEIYQDLLKRVKENDSSYPIPNGDYLYFATINEGEDYYRFCRRLKTDPEDKFEVYFDTNLEAKNYDLYILKGRKLSKDNNHLAYAYNTTGSMEANIRIRNLKTGKDLNLEIENSNGSFVWINNEELIYIERDEFSRGKNVFRVNINKGPANKELIFTKPESMTNMFLHISLTSDEKYCLLDLTSGGSSEVFFMKIDDHKFTHFISGTDDINYDVDHWGNEFFILTNDGEAHNFQIFRTSDNEFERKNWSLMIKEREDEYLYEYMIQNGLIIISSKNTYKAVPEILIFDPKSGQEKTVTFPDEVYDVSVFGSYDPYSDIIRIYYESPVQPEQDIDLNIRTLEQKILHTDEVPNYDHALYQVKREYAVSHDGEEIPLTIISKKDFVKDGKSPVLVYAYGSYGSGTSAYFGHTIFTLLDRGFAYVIAHIRGGDERGNEWYLDGKMENKLNTFKDYISSCEYLIEKKYTGLGKIAANGGSAGGLLMGAVSNMRPDLFKVVVADVAFVDLINTISDATLPLTQPEWEEWGNPIESKDDFEYMMSYSPYDNVKAQDYPNMLFNSGISDEQVTYWEPAKMVAKLREHKTDNNTLLLHMKMNAGHAGASKRYEWIEDKAFSYAFIINNTCK